MTADATPHVAPPQDLEAALATIERHDRHAGDGRWLEDLVTVLGPQIPEWGLQEVHRWTDWPGREDAFPATEARDLYGIDAVGVRGDGALVAVQCKAKGRQPDGSQHCVTAKDLHALGVGASHARFTERWIVTNSSPSPTARTLQTMQDPDRPIRIVNIQAAIERLIRSERTDPEDPRTAMQDKAVREALAGLEKIRGEKHVGWKPGEARGQIIMPCGTGKTRVGYRVATALTASQDGTTEGLILVMAPSIGLVAQLSAAWRALADEDEITIATCTVCSDATAGGRISRRSENTGSLANDPTLDRSAERAADLTGKNADSAQGVADWLRQSRGQGQLRVLFSTYQSGHHTSEGLRETGERAALLIADEAHRTAGIEKRQTRGREDRVRSFTACHDGERIPADNRLYMTATPRTYALDERSKAALDSRKWAVFPMNHEPIFGPEVFRLTYGNAVEGGLLADYQIVTVALPAAAYETANTLAVRHQGAAGGVRRASTSLALRKLAYGLLVAGGIPTADGDTIPIASSIAFLNRINHSKDMETDLKTEAARTWIDARAGEDATDWRIEHRDAGHSLSERKIALQHLAQATPEAPYGVSNVGIFGEGIDTPALAAVAFLEPRTSHVDVVQAVGRVMRRSADPATGKPKTGYILVPIEVPPGRDVETWLATRTTDEGWRELGQILKALRAHDARLPKLRILAARPAPSVPHVVVVVDAKHHAEAFVWEGPSRGFEGALHDAEGDASRSAVDVLAANGTLRPVEERPTTHAPLAGAYLIDDRRPGERRIADVREPVSKTDDQGHYLTTPAAEDAKEAVRELLISRKRKRSKLGPRRRPEPGSSKKGDEPEQEHFRLLDELEPHEQTAERIVLTLQEHSGIRSGPERDVNILENTVRAAGAILREDGLETALRQELELANVDPSDNEADACTVASLLLLTATIMHVRLEGSAGVHGRHLPPVASIASGTDAAETLMRAWDEILDVDYRPIFWSARKVLRRVTRDERKTAAIGSAVRRIATDAVAIADTYADMGMDHAGELFNRIMGRPSQASDGAFFTRPVAAALLAGLALEATGEEDWASPDTWMRLHAFDPACGSGTLLTAFLSAWKNRAQAAGADGETIQRLHRHGVERGIAGLDVNPVSLQLAGAQLTLGDTSIAYRSMGLYEMPYGPTPGIEGLSNPTAVAPAGSLELLTDIRVLDPPRQPQGGLRLDDPNAGQRSVALRTGVSPGLDDVVERLKGRRIAFMNPPFVTRDKLAKKLGEAGQRAVRERIDETQAFLEHNVPGLAGMTDKTSTRPLYVALGLKLIDQDNGVLAMVIPTSALLAPSGREERRILARELRVRWIVTCHEPGNVNMSQRTGINESLVVGTRRDRDRDLPTTFVSLDRLPRSGVEADELARDIAKGVLPPEAQQRDVAASRIRAGDWSPAGWRNLDLDKAYETLLAHPELRPLHDIDGVAMQAPGHGILVPCEPGQTPELRIVNSKSMDAQRTLRGHADTNVRLKGPPDEAPERHARRLEQNLADWAPLKSHLLVCTGQNLQSARLNAVATDEPMLGMRWKPMQGINRRTARAWALWLNSTPGRIATLTQRGKTLAYPVYTPEGLRRIRVPDTVATDAIARLEAAWLATADIEVPSYRDGYVEVRRAWDDAVADALGLSVDEVRGWAALLNAEPAVSLDGYDESLLAMAV